MGENMITLFEEIRCCGGKEGCWGKKNPGCRKPVVIPCKRRPNVMIITEQMNIHEKEWRKNPENIPRDWDSSKELLNVIRQTKEGGRRIGIIPKINMLFDGKFLDDFDVEDMSFNKYYWTHFIKCPGNVRSLNFERRGLALNICAETFLLKEIRFFRPEVIVSMGGLASKWVLEKTEYKNEWTDMLWEELEWVIKGERQIPEREIPECNHRAKIIVLPHPSGINPLATLLNKKFFPKLKVLILQELRR
jgi:uracil-DNA glycosylase